MAVRESQRLFPFLHVDDVGAYLDFLAHAFGFQRRTHYVDPNDPNHQHGEVVLGDEVLMIGNAHEKWGTVAPREQRLQAGVYVRVEDADAHCQLARAAGALIESEPGDTPWGDRVYKARDPEGHQWFFGSPKT
ncbi:MAG TPA: VOC family protein [Candidatus Dormibacteraeota bacterium]|nr:VOC family protein [Candidatus Dormibacteraeota bacterium]